MGTRVKTTALVRVYEVDGIDVSKTSIERVLTVSTHGNYAGRVVLGKSEDEGHAVAVEAEDLLLAVRRCSGS